MIKYINSTVFNVECDAIVNTINCVGFMGKGLAYEFSLRYPDLLIKYQELCKLNQIKTGKIFYFTSKDKLIVNFPTKGHYKYPSKLEWIESGLQDFVNTIDNFNIKSIAFPYLGCSNGGLNQNDVIKLMEKYLKDLNLNIYICSNSVKEPEGKELEMLNKFKSYTLTDFIYKCKINEKQSTILLNVSDKINRFWEISNISGIGKTTYEKLFKYFYNLDNEIIDEQLNFFN